MAKFEEQLTALEAVVERLERGSFRWMSRWRCLRRA